ncbi:MAG: non-canonical purine NTP pyrophosphatase, partial [Lutibacter sp.]|nr:non-canonical purine NTP pyrophosphatase [Lutibacter sp.]
MNKLQLVFATNNKNKLKEVQAMLTNFEIVSLADINCFDDIPETADTLQGNAILKANYVTEKFGLNCFADDTGLEVEALNNEPGVYSARYAGKENNSEANMQKLLKNLENESNKKAQFKTAIALNINGKQFIFEGICKGQILT